MTKGFRGAATHSINIGDTCALAACGKVVVFMRRQRAVIGSAWVHHDKQHRVLSLSTKTLGLILKGHLNVERPPTIRVGSFSLKSSKYIKYLGIELGERLTFKPHLEKLSIKIKCYWGFKKSAEESVGTE